jgi:hypothetical protein
MLLHRPLGKVPAQLFGYDAHGKKVRVLLWLEEAELMREIRKRGPAVENTLYNLYVDGAKIDMRVLPRSLEFHPSE